MIPFVNKLSKKSRVVSLFLFSESAVVDIIILNYKSSFTCYNFFDYICQHTFEKSGVTSLIVF